MSIYRLITEVTEANAEWSVAEIATEVLAQSQPDDLLPLVAEAIEQLRRRRLREREQSQLRDLLDRFQTEVSPQLRQVIDHSEGSHPSLGDLAVVLDDPLRLYDGTETTWGKATLVQIEQRLEHFYKLRTGINTSIRLLERARDLLQRTGAQCLHDLLS